MDWQIIMVFEIEGVWHANVVDGSGKLIAQFYGDTREEVIERASKVAEVGSLIL